MGKKVQVATLILSFVFLSSVISPVSNALTVTAPGDNQGLCTQNVNNLSGVIVTKDGNQCVIQFTSAGNFTWTPQYSITARYLVVGAGGSGTRGFCSYYWGQGGGGGEVLTGTGKSFTGGAAVAITVADATGRSGSCTEVKGADGGASVLDNLTARGGFASLNSRTNNAGAKGGVSGNGNLGGVGTANGVSGCATGNCQSGGGGGAGGAGSGKNGGAGIISDIISIGTNVTYGSGGAGWAGSSDVGTAPSGGGIPGTAECDAPSNRGGGGADCLTPSTGGSGGSGIVVIRYSYNAPPTIGAFAGAVSANYSVNENTTSLFSVNATDPESATITYSLTGADSSTFLISSSGVLSFSSAPDFEAPTDVGADNTYVVVTWVTDGYSYDSQTVTISIVNVSESSTVSAITLSGTPMKGVVIQASVNVNVAGKVRFLLNGKRIAKCLNLPTTGSYPSFTATCNWKPSISGRNSIKAEITPSDNTFSSSISSVLSIFVLNRNTRR